MHIARPSRKNRPRKHLADGAPRLCRGTGLAIRISRETREPEKDRPIEPKIYVKRSLQLHGLEEEDAYPKGVLLRLCQKASSGSAARTQSLSNGSREASRF